MTTGTKVSRIMQKRGISAAELSRKTGMAPSHISRILRSGDGYQCDVATLYVLSDALGEDVAKILPDRKNVLAPA